MRLFLALVPPPELRTRLGELADIAHARCGGRRMPDDRLHLTLAFLGEVDEKRAVELAEWVSTLGVAPGRWRLDSWSCFQRPRIVWIGSQRPAPPLETLQRTLWDGLEARGFPGRPARFVPHVTLLRRADSLATFDLPDIDLAWPYNKLELIQSIMDGSGAARYTTLARSGGA
ncbi:RNA 2',3'-cyclic phosphodiesterase [Billgrantia endophytica]|uniref:RNA 2',3'-cyclic phosphodiesterase n=1 Tax=Billgrantia endophytica TaxID=2033802 RepID=A0A2N7U2U9_9GAMM|nr:RNA 2',3'-cyclic phosphodiesterase [Halomonas endophytica]PMR74765.1 RNA 2',3'-cyclic phosphodiesterase [Halomonas endophytica]